MLSLGHSRLILLKRNNFCNGKVAFCRVIFVLGKAMVKSNYALNSVVVVMSGQVLQDLVMVGCSQVPFRKVWQCYVVVKSGEVKLGNGQVMCCCELYSNG